MEELREALAAALRRAGSPVDHGRPRLWVDRSFVISGAGTVVTGTLSGGPLAVGDQVTVLPAGTEARIRGIQSHETTCDRIGPGSRAAINLTGVDKDEVPRGALLAGPDDLVLSRRVLATLRPVRAQDDPPSERSSHHLHIGTATVPARLKVLDDAEPTATALLDLGAYVPASVGDRFILRDTGRRAVVGGGRILDPFPRRRTSAPDAAMLAAALSGTADDRATALLAVHGRLDAGRLRAATGGGAPADSVAAGNAVLSQDWVFDQTRSLVTITRDFQARHPLRPGIAKAELASRARCERAELDALIAATGGRLVDAGATVHTSDFGTSLSTADEEAWARARPLVAESLAVPRASQLGLSEELTHALVRKGDLIRVGPDLVYLPAQIDEITLGLGRLDDGFTVAQFRDEFGLSRRQAVPLLEWLDGAGRTVRRGDGRVVRKSPP
jgi:selenocysteine-specific elongation factor